VDSPIGYSWNHNYNVIIETLGHKEYNAFQIIDEMGRYHRFQDQNGDGTYTSLHSSNSYLVTEAADHFT
jgi:hypothetical protein